MTTRHTITSQFIRMKNHLRMLIVVILVGSPVALSPTARAEPGDTVWISIGRDGAQPNSGSITPAISADGRFVAFVSPASNLAPGDTNGPYGVLYDVFVHDRETGTTEKVSVDPNGEWANLNSWAPSVSADGRFVAFRSAASNLVPDDDDEAHNIFVRDRLAGSTMRLIADGFPVIDADGSHVAWYGSSGDAFPGIFVYSLITGATERVDWWDAAYGARAGLRAPRVDLHTR